MKTKSALSYFGSDSEVASQLAGMLNQCKHVTIPFVGGASIIAHLKARAIVANDLNNAAINFYRNMSCPKNRNQLIEMCQRTLSHPAETEEAKAIIEKAGDEQLDQMTLSAAWAFWALGWVGRKGKGGTKHLGGMPSVRRTAEAWAKEFERCEWESICFRDLLPKVADKPDCGVYCDPPWVGAGRNYLHNFTTGDHHDLAGLLGRFEQTTVVVRYGDDPLVREIYSDWTIVDAASRDQCNRVKGEIWITNRGLNE